MNYSGTIEYLYGLQKYGMKFGLDNIRRLMSVLGNPQTSFRTVHVAGTNGKGSTSCMISSLLKTSGRKTGLFTSPHLVSFTERIRTNGTEISEQEVIDLAGQVRDAASGVPDFYPTFFEVVTAMAFLHFRAKQVDWAVVETGLGGRLDATNIVTPEVSVITGIDFDHSEFLGRTLPEIAGEKAGIIKERAPVVTAVQSAEAMAVIEKKAAEKMSPLLKYGTDFSSVIVEEGPDGIRLDYSGEREYRGLSLPLRGGHQATNAALAAKTAELIGRAHGLDIDIPAGFCNVVWPGRLEMLRPDPPVMIDGAHNPQAASALASYLCGLLQSRYRRIVLVIGIMADKDIDGILKPLLPLASDIVFTSPAYGRAAAPELLRSHALSMGFKGVTAPGVSAAVTLAEGMMHPGDIMVVTGSFYTIGEAKEFLQNKGVLSDLREFR